MGSLLKLFEGFWQSLQSGHVPNLSADSLWYLLGYSGRIEWVVRHGRWLGVRQRHLDKLREVIVAKASKILFVAKVTVVFIIPSLIAAGLARVRWRRWFPPLVAGEIIWTGGLVAIGYYATSMIRRVQANMRYLAAVGAVVFLVVLVWLVRRALKQSQEFEDSEDGDSDS